MDNCQNLRTRRTRLRLCLPRACAVPAPAAAPTSLPLKPVPASCTGAARADRLPAPPAPPAPSAAAACAACAHANCLCLRCCRPDQRLLPRCLRQRLYSYLHRLCHALLRFAWCATCAL
eukprot:4425143-Pleurochrysis_carterae.AAC.1